MLQVGTIVDIIDQTDLEHRGWRGTITEIDAYASEGDYYGIQFYGSTTTFFRAVDLKEVDLEAEAAAYEADAKDMNQIKREWWEYRHAGDETPPTPPSRM